MKQIIKLQTLAYTKSPTKTEHIIPQIVIANGLGTFSKYSKKIGAVIKATNGAIAKCKKGTNLIADGKQLATK